MDALNSFFVSVNDIIISAEIEKGIQACTHKDTKGLHRLER